MGKKKTPKPKQESTKTGFVKEPLLPFVSLDEVVGAREEK